MKNNTYGFNDNMILDKLIDIFDGKNIEEIDFSENNINIIKDKLSDSISFDDVKESSFILADSVVGECNNDNILDYIKDVIAYLQNSSFDIAKTSIKGIEFDIMVDDNPDEVFNNFYTMYDEIYGISDMLSDFGLK